jgi:hypothetical protein
MARLEFLFVSGNLLQKFERILKFNLGGDRFFDDKCPKNSGSLHILEKI